VAMIASPFFGGNFELVAPAIDGGLNYRERDNSAPGLPWSNPRKVGLGPLPGHPVFYGAVSLIQADLTDRGDIPGRTGRLYVAARCGDRIVYLWRDSANALGWHGPFPVIAVEPDDRRMAFWGAAGNVALIRSHFGALKQDWELMAPALAGGGVLHFWLDNDPEFPLKGDWRVAPQLLQSLGTVDAVALLESQLIQGVFALEVIVRVANRLWFAWRDSALQWSVPIELKIDGLPVVDACGAPSLIQSGFGSKSRNFELVTPCTSGGIAHFWRDNDSDNPLEWQWKRTAQVLDPPHIYLSVSIIESSFGPKPGNLEFVARTCDAEIMHFWRDAATMQWNGPFQVL